MAMLSTGSSRARWKARHHVRWMIVVATIAAIAAIGGLAATRALVQSSTPYAVSQAYPTPDPDPAVYGHIGR